MTPDMLCVILCAPEQYNMYSYCGPMNAGWQQRD